jgi:hypothetical protein
MKRKRLPAACAKMLSNTLKMEINNLVGYIYHMYQYIFRVIYQETPDVYVAKEKKICNIFLYNSNHLPSLPLQTYLNSLIKR